jgi:hypothetical protein
MPSNLARVRKICLSLPQSTEVESWGAPTFRVGRIFAMYAGAGNHHHEGEGIWVKTDSFTQDLLVRGQPTRYFSPPYVGPSGWTGVYLNPKTDWIALTDLLRDAWRATASKKIAALLPDDDEPATKSAPAPAKQARRKAPAKKTTAKKRAATRRPARKASRRRTAK